MLCGVGAPCAHEKPGIGSGSRNSRQLSQRFSEPDSGEVRPGPKPGEHLDNPKTNKQCGLPPGRKPPSRGHGSQRTGPGQQWQQRGPREGLSLESGWGQDTKGQKPSPGGKFKFHTGTTANETSLVIYLSRKSFAPSGLFRGTLLAPNTWALGSGQGQVAPGPPSL